MNIAIASDHAAYELKMIISDWLITQGHSPINFGTDSIESCDYPDYAYPAAIAVANKEADLGIVLCGSGIGMSIVCNKVEGIRAANCVSPEMAKLARQHNDANILNLGARLIDSETAKNIASIFINTKFEGGRHEERVNKIKLRC